LMAKIAAQRIVRHMERARFVVMKKPPLGGHAFGRGNAHGGDHRSDP
jgi:hypothetical protein